MVIRKVAEMTDTNKVDVEPVGTLSIWAYKGLGNHDFTYHGDLPDGDYPLVLASALAAMRQENERLKSSNESYITLANTAYEITSTLRTQLAEAQADAARYKYLKSRCHAVGHDGGWVYTYQFYPVKKSDTTPYAKSNGGYCNYETLDAAIDAAMKGDV
jgi:hypothetical protein